MIFFDEVAAVKFRLAGGRVDLDHPACVCEGALFTVKACFNNGTAFKTPPYTLTRSGTVVAVNVDAEHNIKEVFYSD